MNVVDDLSRSFEFLGLWESLPVFHWLSFRVVNGLLWPLTVFQSLSFKFPRGGLVIFTDRDQRSIFWVLNFENLYFFGYWSQLLHCFGLLNKCCILKCFLFLTVFFGYSFMYQVLQLSLFFIIIISCLTFAIRCVVISGGIFSVLLFRKYF